LLHITYIGGATALIEYAGVRVLTDPAFDAAGGEYVSGPVTLHKTSNPALSLEQLEPIDLVLLSHDQHFDNLDHAGRAMLPQAGKVLTTTDGAMRLNDNAIGLEPWQSVEVGAIRITGTPAQHGPAGSLARSGPVTGFVLETASSPTLYFSGDTVWFDGVAEVARRFAVDIAVLNMGGAKVAAAGPDPLTMTAEDGVATAHAMAKAMVAPLHFEGWAHFMESGSVIEKAFAQAGLSRRLCLLHLGVRTPVLSALH
jgi:L-ascorbate metabolism protein UlaG (beta-lactamase superfamily)